MEGTRNHINFSPSWSQWKTGILFSTCSTYSGCFSCPPIQRFSLPCSDLGKPHTSKQSLLVVSEPFPNSYHSHIKNHLKASKTLYISQGQWGDSCPLGELFPQARHTYEFLWRSWKERPTSCLPFLNSPPAPAVKQPLLLLLPPLFLYK